MVLPDPPPSASSRQRRVGRPDHVLAILAIAMGNAVVTLQVAEIATGRALLPSGFLSMLLVATGFLGMAWLVVAAERRLVLQLRRIEGTRYRDGYAAGYLDGAAAARARLQGSYERPSLRPVK